MNHQLNPQIAQIGNSMGNSSNIPTTTNSMNRPTSAYFNSSNNSNVMNLSSTPSIPNATQSTSTGNLMQTNPSALMGFNHNNNTNNMMPSPAQQHLSHPNLGGMSNASSSITNSPITPHRPPIMPNKTTQQQNVGFIRDARMNSQQQMMAPSMPNIAHTSSGYATNIPASQSMQSVNPIPGNYYIPQQQFQDTTQQMQYQQQQNPQLSPNHQASLLRGTAKMTEMGELLKRQQRNHPSNGPIHFANSMDNIHIPQSNTLSHPQMLSPNSQNRQSYHPQSPQKQPAPNTAPKPQVKARVFTFTKIHSFVYFLTSSFAPKWTDFFPKFYKTLRI
jgi:hypothetical protein